MQFESYLKPENIFFKKSVTDWQEAVHVAVAPMIEQGYCSPAYAEGIIENTFTYGSYYVLKEGFALLHAKSEQGAIDTQISITFLEEPVVFLNSEKQVTMLFLLVAKDATSHIDCMQKLAILLSDETIYQNVLKSQNAQDVYRIFTNLG